IMITTCLTLLRSEPWAERAVGAAIGSAVRAVRQSSSGPQAEAGVARTASASAATGAARARILVIGRIGQAVSVACAAASKIAPPNSGPHPMSKTRQPRPRSGDQDDGCGGRYRARRGRRRWLTVTRPRAARKPGLETVTVT